MKPISLFFLVIVNITKIITIIKSLQNMTGDCFHYIYHLYIYIPLSSNEINVLKLGLSFTSTPKSNIPELEADIFDFIRKLRLTYHFRNSIYHDE